MNARRSVARSLWPLVGALGAWCALAQAAATGALGTFLPGEHRLTGVRVAGDVDQRVVLDLEGPVTLALWALGGIGRVEAGAALRLEVPQAAAGVQLPDRAGTIDLRWHVGPDGGFLEAGGGAFSYDVFALAEPTRLVIDLRPDRDAARAAAPVGGPVHAASSGEVVEALAPGVTYRSFRAPGRLGPSSVHLLEVAAGAGEWRVVGAQGETRPTVRWAQGAFAAINGGYFDPGSRTSIGLLVVDGNWLSMPSRGRAAVGFGPDGVVIDRVTTRTAVWIDDQLVLSAGHPLARDIELHANPGAWAGSARAGALSLDGDGRVIDNRAGPVRVPLGGQVVVYPPELRALALADPPALVRTSLTVDPVAFRSVRYAVEAGPLLVRDGVAALAPASESFAEGVRILDDVTQQAAIGVRADGTVLLLAAEAMTAADLVPLLLQLGAQDAMRLDSGGSTTLVADGRVLNRRTERAVVNAIVWRSGAGP